VADWKIPLAVAVGGALGAVARHLTVGLVDPWLAPAFPVGTLAANAVGSFLMGAFIEATALIWSPSPALRAMIAVGVLGAFTTFSAFALDTIRLLGQGDLALATAYMLATVVLSLLGIFGGMRLLRRALV